MIVVKIYRFSDFWGSIECNAEDVLTIKGTSEFKEFVKSLEDEEYASNKEFLRDLPERLSSYIFAQIEKDE